MVRKLWHQGEHGPIAPASNEGVVLDGPWRDMYRRDLYARDRVMKSARMLLPYVKDGDTVLDVGCFTMEAKKYFAPTVKYVGLDSTKFHRETKVTDLHHGFLPVPCQGALCLETLEHLVDPRDCLASIRESLSESGYLVVSLPNEVTLFHRLRCLMGVVDAECFSGEGKHLHLPSLKQARGVLQEFFQIVDEQYYISPTANGSRSAWVGRILSLLPRTAHQFLADHIPSLFARGFIFLLKPSPKK